MWKIILCSWNVYCLRVLKRIKIVLISIFVHQFNENFNLKFRFRRIFHLLRTRSLNQKRNESCSQEIFMIFSHYCRRFFVLLHIFICQHLLKFLSRRWRAWCLSVFIRFKSFAEFTLETREMKNFSIFAIKFAVQQIYQMM